MNQHNTAFLDETKRICGKILTLIDIDKSKPLLFDPQNIGFLVLPSFIFQVIFGSRIECPLKRGNPFRCPSSESSEETLCGWRRWSEGQSPKEADLYECIIDDLANAAGIEEYLAH